MVGVGLIVCVEGLRNAGQPFVEFNRLAGGFARIQRRKRPDDARGALCDDQLGIRDDEERATDQRDPQILKLLGQCHSVFLPECGVRMRTSATCGSCDPASFGTSRRACHEGSCRKRRLRCVCARRTRAASLREVAAPVPLGGRLCPQAGIRAYCAMLRFGVASGLAVSVSPGFGAVPLAGGPAFTVSPAAFSSMKSRTRGRMLLRQEDPAKMP